jgi:hypothetical protein
LGNGPADPDAKPGTAKTTMSAAAAIAAMRRRTLVAYREIMLVPPLADSHQLGVYSHRSSGRINRR